MSIVRSQGPRAESAFPGILLGCEQSFGSTTDGLGPPATGVPEALCTPLTHPVRQGTDCTSPSACSWYL
jgi:hypothetical protein